MRATLAGPLRGVAPAKVVLLGYLACVVAGWALLALPWAHAVPGTAALDHLFTATSAVSTTGLATVPPSETYALFGELVILLLIQLGGVGYMTVGSFIVLASGKPLSAESEELIEHDFSVPEEFSVSQFVRGVVVFTLACETLGALALWALFAQAGVPEAGYQAVFHAVSAFSTAGFSLFDTSLEAFAGNVGVNAVVAILAYLGAIGFIVAVDVWRVGVRHRERLTFTSRIILRLTLLLTVVGTAGLFLTEQSVLSGGTGLRLMESLFQTMAAMTTVGFSTVPIGALSQGAMMVVLLLMIVGASPSGTGGGVKTTTLAAVYAVMRSVLSGQRAVTVWHRRLPIRRFTEATASFAFYMVMLASGVFVLTLTETATFDQIVFETASALSTVGLSLGITGDLSAAGKLLVVVLMFAGRLGALTFGSALFLHHDDEEDGPEEDVVV